MTTQITGGAVEFTRPSNYASGQSGAKVSLAFSCAEGTPEEEAVEMLDRVIALSLAKAQGMVANKSPAPVAEVAQPKAADTAAVYVRDTHIRDIMGNAVAPNPTVTDAQPAAAVEPQVAPATVISDKLLMDEVTARNAALITAAGDDDIKRQRVPVAVHGLIGQFTDVPPGPGRLSKIEQDKRVDFLKALGELAV